MKTLFHWGGTKSIFELISQRDTFFLNSSSICKMYEGQYVVQEFIQRKAYGERVSSWQRQTLQH